MGIGISIVNREDDLNGNNIVEKIGKQLQERELSTYKEWEKKNFDINYEFSHNGCSDKEKFTLLRVAFLDNQENVVKALLAVNEINVNFQDISDKTPLHLAIEKGNVDIVKALLAVEGIDVNLRDKSGSTLLHLAIEKGNVDIVKALLAVEGIDVNLRDTRENTPLYCAAQKGKMEIVEAILAKKPDIDLPNEYGHTPLYVAAREHHKKIVRALLEKGADPLLGNRDNKTLDKDLTEEAIMTAIILGVGIFVIASVVAAIIVTSAYFIGVSLSVGAMAGIAVAAAVLTGLVAGGITYEVCKPCDELKEAIAKEISKPSQNSAVDDSKPDCSLENPGTRLLAPVKGFINKAKSFCVI